MDNIKDLEAILNLVSTLSNSNKSKDNKQSNLDILSVLDVFMPTENNKTENIIDDVYEDLSERTQLKSIINSSNYMQYNNQKNILILIKLMEIKRLVQNYNDANYTNEKIDMYMLLNEIVPYTNKDTQGDIKKCLDLISLQKGFVNK